MLSLRQEDPGFSYNKNIIGLGQVVKRPSDEGTAFLFVDLLARTFLCPCGPQLQNREYPTTNAIVL